MLVTVYKYGKNAELWVQSGHDKMCHILLQIHGWMTLKI